MTRRRTLVADPGPALRGWLRAGLGPRAGEVVEVAKGWEVLWRLAEERYDLVVLGPHLTDVPSVSLLAMVRAAGLRLPFLMVLPFAATEAATVARKLAPSVVVDDWTDGHALRRGCELLLMGDRASLPRASGARVRLRKAAARRLAGVAMD